MNEKVLTKRKHGMLVLLLTILINLAALAGTIYGGILLENGGNAVLMVVSLIVLCIAWLPIPGLKVLKP